ncbi:MAG: redoxin domain-containing protein [Desulforhopalus sp.]
MKKNKIARLSFTQKTGLVVLVIAVTLLQSTVSTPSLKTLGVGMEAPEFSLNDLSDKKQTFSTLRGDTLTLLLFWASWSKNSGKALSRMEQLHNRYTDRGFSVIGINVEKQNIDGETETVIKKVVDSLQLSFPILVDRGLVTFHNYGVIAVPTIIILDKDRKIMFEMSGFPVVGRQEMTHFLAAEIEGKVAPVEMAGKTGYHPDKKAVRSWNMGVKALKSKRMADSAEMWFKKAILADPNFILPYLSLGSFYRAAGEIDAAKAQFGKAVALKPDNSAALCNLALILIEEGSLSDARKMLEKALQTDEAYTPGYYYLAYLTGKEGNMQKATELFGRAEEINPMDYRINVYRGKLFEEQQKLEPAAMSFKKGLQQLLQLQ